MTPNYEQQYLQILHRLYHKAEERQKDDRTGTGTASIFGPQMQIDLRQGFPLLTSKKIYTSSIIEEMLWFLSGSTNANDLQCKIWDAWADNEGDLGPIYGKQWRSWGGTESRYGIDQIAIVLDQLTHNPDSRRIIVSAWNVEDLPDETQTPHENVLRGNMALAPCHTLFQFYTEEMTLEERTGLLYPKPWEQDSDKVTHSHLDSHGVPRRFLDCKLYQRSADWFLGVPFNTPSYALLMHMFGHQLNMVPRTFYHTFGDAHLYLNHLEQAREQLLRPQSFTSGIKLEITRKAPSIDAYSITDFRIHGYSPQGPIKAPISV